MNLCAVFRFIYAPNLHCMPGLLSGIKIFFAFAPRIIRNRCKSLEKNYDIVYNNKVINLIIG
jgi:hypothetical protein